VKTKCKQTNPPILTNVAACSDIVHAYFGWFLKWIKERFHTYCTCQNCKIIGKVKMETTGMWGLPLIKLKDIKYFQIWAYFEGIGINFNLFYWINLNHPQIHWSIIFMVFIRIPLQFLTYQWKRSVNKPTLQFYILKSETLYYMHVQHMHALLCLWSLVNQISIFRQS
jgi:hypothetical protein